MSLQNTSAPCSPYNTCYFSLQPQNTTIRPDETPFSAFYTSPDEVTSPDAQSPPCSFTSYSNTPSNYRMDASRLIQLQSKGLHSPTLHRPQPQPIQNMLVIDESDDSGESSSSSDSSPSPPTVRCSRCQKMLNMDANTGRVSYGLNLYYCSRCAAMVGYSR